MNKSLLLAAMLAASVGVTSSLVRVTSAVSGDTSAARPTVMPTMTSRADSTACSGSGAPPVCATW